MKTCHTCKTEKPIERFGSYKGGLNPECKDCNKARANKHYHANKGPNKRELKKAHYLAHKEEIDAERKARKAQTRKLWYQRNADRMLDVKKAWLEKQGPRWNAEQKAKYRAEHLEQVRASQLEATRKDREKHPEKWRCRWAVSNAIRSGKLARPSTMCCVDCGKQASRYDHYLGYAPENRLAVQPVCAPCDGLREKARGYRRQA